MKKNIPMQIAFDETIDDDEKQDILAKIRENQAWIKIFIEQKLINISEMASFKCDKCGDKFMTENAYNAHLEIEQIITESKPIMEVKKQNQLYHEYAQDEFSGINYGMPFNVNIKNK